MPQNEQNNPSAAVNTAACNQCPLAQKPQINTHFALAVVAVCLSCLSGFLTIAMGIAALILSLRAQDQLAQGQYQEASSTAWWAGLFGWVTVVVSLLPLLLLFFFGGALLAALGALLSL